jgi:hypothetical protein
MGGASVEKEPAPEAEDEPGSPVSFLARDIRVIGGEITLKDATNDRLRKGISLMGISVKLKDISLDRPMAMEASAGIGRTETDLKFTFPLT